MSPDKIRKWNKRLKLAQTVIKPREWTLLARRIWNMSGSPCVMSSSVYSSSLMQLKSFSRPWISGRRCCTKHVRRDSSHVCRVQGTPVYRINESVHVCDSAESICHQPALNIKPVPSIKLSTSTWEHVLHIATTLKVYGQYDFFMFLKEHSMKKFSNIVKKQLFYI